MNSPSPLIQETAIHSIVCERRLPVREVAGSVHYLHATACLPRQEFKGKVMTLGTDNRVGSWADSRLWGAQAASNTNGDFLHW